MHRQYWDNHLTLAEVGGHHNMSGETVRSLFVKYGLPRRPRGYVMAMESQQRREQLNTQIVVMYRRLGSISQICKRTGRSRRFVARVLDEAGARIDIRPAFTRTQLQAAMKQASHNGRLSVSAYARWFVEDPNTRPSVVDIVRTYGSWHAALRVVRLSGCAGPAGTTVSDEACLQALRSCAEEMGNCSSRAYAAWTVDHGAPSVATITNRFGSWSTAQQIAAVLA